MQLRALKELDGLPSLRSLEWWDWVADALPQYLREANLKKLRVDCSRSLLKLIALQDESSEWEKIKHVQQLKAYGHKKGEEENWYIYYTKEPYSFDAYLGESTGDFIFDLLKCFYSCRFVSRIKWIHLTNLNSFVLILPRNNTGMQRVDEASDCYNRSIQFGICW